MNRKIEVRNTICRMIEVLYWLELMDWDARWDAQVACDAYYMRLKENGDEK